MNQTSPSAGNVGKWWVCGLLLMALMLNYMDRQTLSLTIVPISDELGLSNTQYGLLEKGFGYAFAVGGLVAGWLADKVQRSLAVSAGSARRGRLRAWPAVTPTASGRCWPAPRLSWWPGAADPHDPASCAFLGFFVCRTVLGFFEVRAVALCPDHDPAAARSGRSAVRQRPAAERRVGRCDSDAVGRASPGHRAAGYAGAGRLSSSACWACSGFCRGRGSPPASRLEALPRASDVSSGETAVAPVPRGLLVRRFLALGSSSWPST